MRRVPALLLSVALLLAIAPARAETINGSVMLPTYGTPAFTRLSNGTVPNGTFGYLFPLVKKSGKFTLRTLPAGLTGLEDFDIFFYRSLDLPAGEQVGGIMCADHATVCTQDIPSGANYAIVTLSTGLAGQFQYTS